MKRWLQLLAGRALFASGLARIRLSRAGVVVAFRRVNDRTASDPHAVGVEAFEEFCHFFRDRFHVIPLSELVARCESRRSLGASLAITFDGGYLDNFTNAAPILRSLGLPATFFLVTGYVGRRVVPAWDRGLDPPPRWMTWDQVRALCSEGHAIGAQTRTAPDLGRLVGPAALEELVGSRMDIEKQIDAPVDLFGYPFGGRKNFAEANRPLVRQAGFRCCASGYGGTNPNGIDPFWLRRIPIGGHLASPWLFAREAARRRRARPRSRARRRKRR